MAINISEICDSITKVFKGITKPLPKIPSILLEMGVMERPGLSAINITSKIITRQTEAGAPYGPMPDGSRNVAEAMERIRVEEMVNALKMDSQIQIAIPPGGIVIQATGANAGGPVVSVGTNINYVTGLGIIQ